MFDCFGLMITFGFCFLLSFGLCWLFWINDYFWILFISFWLRWLLWINV